MARTDPETQAHRTWLGLLQPVGLVVSSPALIQGQAVPPANVLAEQQALLDRVRNAPPRPGRDPEPAIPDFAGFARDVLGWAPEDLAGGDGGPPLPEGLEVPLPDHGDTLRPRYAVLDAIGGGRVLMLVQELAIGTGLDDLPAAKGGWQATPHARFERLLRDTGVAAGILLNGHQLRLVYAPRGESSGHVTFPVPAMCAVEGRPILGALLLLLSEHRVFSAPDGRRLEDLLRDSRRYQSRVSTKLADQVLGALWELLQGFQAADEAADSTLIDSLAREDPEHLYGGLLTVIMRLVFLLYAEDQGLMPDGPVYAGNYAVGGLHQRLRDDDGHYPDTMDQRYGAWASLLALFRLVYDGGGHGSLRLPTRHGQLFNPDEYPFLEGRARGIGRIMGESFEAPRVSDGVIFRVLEGLLVLDGERLSYRALDVEQIGSVYEAMMGFSIERAFGRSIAVRKRIHGVGVDVVFDVDALVAVTPKKRIEWLRDRTDVDLTGNAAGRLRDATSPDEVVAALGKRISPRTRALLPPGSLFLQPGEERRRSGSHYTPRELTEPIVRHTLAPVLRGLGPRPTPEQLLALAVCDPAMGSGAFLVEACRQLAEALVEAWAVHDRTPTLPPDEDALLHARRLIAQRCLYGVDRNRFAVNLAKLSLWLVTMARDHAFTFLDHALKHGDSLVGLSRAQIGAFHWKAQKKGHGPLFEGLSGSMEEATRWRGELRAAADGAYDEQRRANREAEEALDDPRLVGDLIVDAFFSGRKQKDREVARLDRRRRVDAWRAGAVERIELAEEVRNLRAGSPGLAPLHWELEFPEVFGRRNPGFDAVVGNPPFAGKNTIVNGNRSGYLHWLKTQHLESHGNADLVAHFFRRAFSLLRESGAFGLIATNTIAQGDTRSTGLRWIATHGGTIYRATRRFKWPGSAAVVVSVVHVRKGAHNQKLVLDEVEVPTITAFLFHAGGNDDPATLRANADLSFVGSYVLGMGFTFDDTDRKGVASPLAEMERLVAVDPRNQERIFPYIGGEEVNDSPTHTHHRYVINFDDMTEDEARQWPDLMAIVEERVMPERMKDKRAAYRNRWWQFAEKRADLAGAIYGKRGVLAIARVGERGAFAFLPSNMVYSEQLIVFPLETYAAFCALQSRPHELWARFLGSSMKDDLRYTPSDCFETFPFPEDWATQPALEAAGRAYYEFRADLMVRNNEGLTATYNRFHDPEVQDPAILELRRLHEAMDRAVLDAYGWPETPTYCEFALAYEIDEESWSPRRKKPWRYGWPPEVHDEVLASLLELNRERAEQERLSGAAGEGKKRVAKPSSKRPAPQAATHDLSLFPTDPQES
ncbi:MAG: N-6 DNA methylase [Longimicrobiales bacterium]|nr:N-6 DNA methylase [Longimicrobiales bacterium]